MILNTSMLYFWQTKYIVVIRWPEINTSGRIGKPVRIRRSRATVTGMRHIVEGTSHCSGLNGKARCVAMSQKPGDLPDDGSL